MNKKFKFQLSFISLVKFSTLIGSCFGVLSIPLVFIFSIPTSDSAGILTIAPMIIISVPVMGAINGALVGIIGYPLYKWFSSKIGLVYSGTVYVNE